ncbi:cytochrome P450 [Serendipita vermifera]|nr:cytochrome P450 [Serendipita vermifera]
MDDIVTRALDSPVETCTISLAVASLGYFTIRGVLNRKKCQPYPPGPPRQPFIGSFRSFPADHFYYRFSEWARLYGDIVYAPLPGSGHLILNSPDIAQELLGKRPNSTAGRGIGYLVRRLLGWDWMLAFVQPNSHHANQRKMFRRGIGPQKINSHDELIESEVEKLMPVLQTFQGNPLPAVQHAVSQILIKLTYGEKIWAEMGEDLVRADIEAVDRLTKAIFTFWYVDVFHFLRFIPDWFPGLPFKAMTRNARKLTQKVRYEPYKRGLELYKSGSLDDGLLHDLLEEFGDQDDVRDTTATIFSAASNMIPSALIAALHALFLHPMEVQKVFEEIQSVTHGQRLPNLSDRSSLPYTLAVLRECIRWRTYVPLGIPHVNDQDEIIRGYLIPKGTSIHLNFGQVWGDPEAFRPERFLEEGAAERPDPLSLAFGFGMRVCPGMYLADHMIISFMITIFSLFKVVPLEGKGVPDPKSVDYEDKMTRHPIGFECRFAVQDDKAEQLIQAVALGGQ